MGLIRRVGSAVGLLAAVALLAACGTTETATTASPDPGRAIAPCAAVGGSDAGLRTDGETPDLSSTRFDGPLVITRGGTYTGNWQSLDPQVPAVMVRTTDPVVIDGARITGRDHLIEGVAGVRLTVRNTIGQGLNPGVPGQAPGRFVVLHDAAELLAENNDLVGTSGIRVEGYTGRPGRDTYRVLGNRATNIDGRRSDGPGFTGDDRTAELVQFVQLVEVRDVPGIEIGWNDVHNAPGRSRVEDVISVFRSSGQRGSPIRIHDNFIDGAYPTDPTIDEYSGGGIMVGDGDGLDVPAFIEATGNSVINTTGHGMAVSSGTDVVVRGNRILSTGQLPDGRGIRAQNVGLYVFNIYGLPRFGPVDVVGNVIGWERSVSGGGRNDSWTPDASGVEGNVPFAGTVTLNDLAAEYRAWRCRAQS